MKRLAPSLPALVLLSLAGRVDGYELEITARTIGQGYQLRSPRPDERDRVLNRRRLTQTLSLDIWDILEPAYDAGRPHEPPLAPFDLYVSASARLLHDFGGYTGGSLIVSTSPTSTVEEAASSAVPELEGEKLALEVLWAVVGARGILDRLDVSLGRQLVVGELDWYAFDGIAASVRLPLHLALEGQAGLLVRDASPAASPTSEPDGSSSAECVAYVSGADLQPAGCDTREAAAPTFGAALATHGLRALSARVSYRRTVSATPDGVYPDDRDQAPSWGVLEEKLGASVRGRLAGGAVAPWAAARYNLVVGLVDEANAGVRLKLGEHALTPEVRYSYPSFDGDSIWNVFAVEAYGDARLGYDLTHGRLRAYARAFARRFAASAGAGGGEAGGRLAWDGGALRLDLQVEDGHGGLRAGGDVSGRWRAHRRVELEGRLSLVRFDGDLRVGRAATSFGVQAGAVLALGPGMAVHLLAEENANRFDDQLRLLAVLDLAFRPEH